MRKSFAVIVALLICSVLLVPAKGQGESQAADGPLTLQALNILLRREVGRNMTEADLAVRVERFGIAFDPTPDADQPAQGKRRASESDQRRSNARLISSRLRRAKSS